MTDNDLVALHSVVRSFQQIADSNVLAAGDTPSNELPAWLQRKLESVIREAELLQQNLNEILDQLRLHQSQFEDER